MFNQINDINNGFNVGDYVSHKYLAKKGTIVNFEWSVGRAAAVRCDDDPSCVYVFNVYEIELANKLKPVKITKTENVLDNTKQLV